MNLPTFQPIEANHFVVTLRDAGGHRKMFGVQFRRGPKGLDLFVHLAYFRHSFGPLGRFTLHGPAGTSGQIRFAKGARTTTERVKYSHHADGHTGFTQDRRIVSEIKTRAERLRDARGHLFTVQFWGADGFAPVTSRDLRAPTPSRATLEFEVDTPLDPNLLVGRISGWCYPRRMVSLTNTGGPAADATKPIAWPVDGGESRSTLVLAPPSPPAADNVVVLLTYHGLPPRQDPGEPILMFLGGFEAPGDPMRSDAFVNFLALKYAARDDGFDDMVKTLGSVDYRPGAPPFSAVTEE